MSGHGFGPGGKRREGLERAILNILYKMPRVIKSTSSMSDDMAQHESDENLNLKLEGAPRPGGLLYSVCGVWPSYQQ